MKPTQADKHLAAEMWSSSLRREHMRVYIQPKSVIPNLFLTLLATIWANACILNAAPLSSGFEKALKCVVTIETQCRRDCW